jgi:hypothetical protein
MTNRLAHDLDSILARTEPLWQELRGQRILITGATGFFGCCLLESFAWANRRLNLNAHAVAVSRHPQVLAQKARHLASDPAIALHAAQAADMRRLSFCVNANFACASRALGQYRSNLVVKGGRRLSRPGHESLTLAFCLATRRCMNLEPSFL